MAGWRKGKEEMKGSDCAPPQPGRSTRVKWLHPRLPLERGEGGRGPVWAQPGSELIGRMGRQTPRWSQDRFHMESLAEKGHLPAKGRLAMSRDTFKFLIVIAGGCFLAFSVQGCQMSCTAQDHHVGHIGSP